MPTDAATKTPASLAIALPAPQGSVVLRRNGFRSLLVASGPAFVVSVAFIDPGNFATNIEAGARNSYDLLWVVALSSLVAMLYQTLSAKLGIVTGRNLAELCRLTFPKGAVWAFWLISELAAMATDLAEFLGAAIGFKLLFGMPLVAGALLGDQRGDVLPVEGEARRARCIRRAPAEAPRGREYEGEEAAGRSDAGQLSLPKTPSSPNSGAQGRIVSSFRRMLGMVELLWDWLVSLTGSRRRLEAEILLLRHQLNILRRNAPRHMRLTNADRLAFVWLYRLCPAVIDTVTIVRPATLIRWHRRGFRAFWRWKSRPRGGRPAIPRDIRDLIREMSRANWLWGAPRIHGELLKLGIEIAESTVAKYMVRRPKRPGQSWRTFLRNHADGIAAVDFFVVPTISFKLLYCLVFLAHGRRQLMDYAVTAHPTAEWIAQQIVEAFPWDEAPRYLVRDRDAVYGEVVKRRLRGLGIRDRPIAPRSPWQNAYVERLIGSARRECIDHVIVLGESHLRRIMSRYAGYYNETRTHLSLGKDAPIGRAIERSGRIIASPWSVASTTATLESSFR